MYCLRLPFAFVLALVFTGTALAGGTHSAHEVPQLLGQARTTVTYESKRVTVTFGPVDLPSAHDGELAASMPKHVFELPEDMTLVGYRSRVFTKDGVDLPQLAASARARLFVAYANGATEVLPAAAPDPMALYRLDHGEPPFMRSAAVQ